MLSFFFQQFIGSLGAFLILLGFAFSSFKKSFSHTKLYFLFNLFGSGLLVFYAFLLGSVPFFILNIVWFFVALIKLF